MRKQEGFSKAELQAGAMARKIIMAPVARFPDLVEDVQLKHRGFFREVGGISFPGAHMRCPNRSGVSLRRPIWAR